MASWLGAGGFNTNFAPVVDVNVNPASPGIGQNGRSFSRIPLTVTSHASRFVDEFHARNVMTTLKHFPGHGSATSDSHFSLPDITRTWADSELIPYRELLARNSVDIVMTGHLYNAHIDSVYPTSLSYNAVTRLLRDSLHYNGVVITDDLYNMAAITDRYGFGAAARLAVNAGTDVLLYVWNLRNGSSLCKAVIDTIEAQVLGGAISAARIDESYTRIMQLKGRYLSTDVEGGRISASGSPGGFFLSNYPNPFNPSTNISYAIPASSRVVVEVYNTIGQLITRLVEEDQIAGYHTVVLDGSGLAGGVYFCRVTAGPRAETRKLLLIK
jgi:beta-N-acetylhexosaminidase